MGSVLPFASLMAVFRASAEKMLPLTAMIFWPGKSFALSAGPFQRMSAMLPSPVRRMPMEYQTSMPPRRPPVEAIVRAERLGLSV